MSALNPPGSQSWQWLNYPAPPVHEVLRRMFRLASTSWAREFLFHPNGTVDAGILTSPLHLQYKVAGQICLDWKQERPPPHLPQVEGDLSAVADGQLYADWIIIPAFNFEQQGACYFMHKERREKGPAASTDLDDTVDDNGAVRSALYRIITDDVTGEVLYVGDMPETDKFQVIYMRHINSAFHERAMCFFEGSVFRAALSAEDAGGGLSLQHLAKALTLCIHTRETRLCLECGASPSAFCNCPVRLKKAEHPHDLRYYAFNARSHLGQYTGKEYLMYMRNGVEIARRPQLTQHRTDGDADGDVAHALRVWAVQDRLGNVLSRVISSPKDRAFAEAMQNVEYKDLGEVVDDLADVDARIEASHAAAVAARWNTPAHHVQGQWNPQLLATEVDLTSTATVGTPPNVAHVQVMHSAHSPAGPAHTAAYLRAGAASVGSGSVGSGSGSISDDLTQRLETSLLLPESPTTPPYAVYSVPLPAASAPIHPQALRASQGGSSSGVPAPTVTAANAARIRRAQVRERRLLPRGNRPVVPAPAPKDRELELRIRKREAARRSDQRRLAKVQQLQEETDQLEKRAKHLRQRQKQLREENDALRGRLATSCATAGGDN